MLAALLLAGCATPVHEATDGEPAEETTPPRAAPAPRVVRFLAFGDAGYGSPEQRQVAEAMARVCERAGCDLALLLGDNIYWDGVNGTDDPDWQTKFEEPYANLSIPFYAVLGNHDVAHRDEDGDNGDHQVAYTKVSPKWRMPARSHAFAQGPAWFYALDLTRAATAKEPTPEEWDTMDELNETLDDARRPWRIVYSHFPLVANGKYGAAGDYSGEAGRGAALRALVETAVCPRADLYLAGHEHILEWLQPTETCPDTELVVSGAAGSARAVTRDEFESRFAAGDTLGFFWFEATETTLTGRAYDANGSLLYERTLANAAPEMPEEASLPAAADARRR